MNEKPIENVAQSARPTTVALLEGAITAALKSDGIVLAHAAIQRFAKLIQYSRLARERGVRRVPRPAVDILILIEEAIRAGDLHEAVWRSFLGAHFARLSASLKDGNVESAGRFLCAFGREPVWTWTRIKADCGRELKRWLDSESDVRSLTFGNHRQHELPTEAELWETIKSFIDFAASMNGPANVVKAPGASDPAERFDILFTKFSKIRRFGRLGSFDFIDLLLDVGLVKDAEPAHCYLRGATGPLKGARQIWGNKAVEVLDGLAARLAKKLGISCFVLEDALCNYQKADHEPCCGDLDDNGNCRL